MVSDRTVVEYYTCMLAIPDRLADFVAALQSEQPVEGIQGVFGCNEEIANLLTRTQFRVLTTHRREVLLEQLRGAQSRINKGCEVLD